jgi:hypothetical protein
VRRQVYVCAGKKGRTIYREFVCVPAGLCVRRQICVCAGEKRETPFKQGGGSRTIVVIPHILPDVIRVFRSVTMCVQEFYDGA